MREVGQKDSKIELEPPGRGDFAIGDARGEVEVVAERKMKSTLSLVSFHVAHRCFCVENDTFWEEPPEEGHLLTSGDIH